jgi:hypothetical protein
MTCKYALKHEYSDCTLSEPFACFSDKAEALRVARHCAKTTTPGGDVVRIWVDDKIEDCGVKSFEVRQ